MGLERSTYRGAGVNRKEKPAGLIPPVQFHPGQARLNHDIPARVARSVFFQNQYVDCLLVWIKGDFSAITRRSTFTRLARKDPVN